MSKSAKLKISRELCGLTREDLAAVAGVETRTIKYWERTDGRVPDDVLAYLDGTLKSIQALTKALMATNPSTLPLARPGATIRGVPAVVWNGAVRQCWCARPEIDVVWAGEDATAD